MIPALIRVSLAPFVTRAFENWSSAAYFTLHDRFLSDQDIEYGNFTLTLHKSVSGKQHRAKHVYYLYRVPYNVITDYRSYYDWPMTSVTILCCWNTCLLARSNFWTYECYQIRCLIVFISIIVHFNFLISQLLAKLIYLRRKHKVCPIQVKFE